MEHLTLNNECHLYPGFKYVGMLQSISLQRSIQARVLANLRAQRMLVVGCGYGEELGVLLGSHSSAGNWPAVTLIDLADVAKDLAAQPYAAQMEENFTFRQMNLLDITNLEMFGAFDCVQCSFVLHDFCAHEKDNAMWALAKAVLPGGFILISDIFVRREGDPTEVIEIYDGFIREAICAFQAGRLNRDQFDSLLGNGEQMGLARTRREAALGQRDFFERPETLIARAHGAGLSLAYTVSNQENQNLAVLVFRRDLATD